MDPVEEIAVNYCLIVFTSEDEYFSIVVTKDTIFFLFFTCNENNIILPPALPKS